MAAIYNDISRYAEAHSSNPGSVLGQVERDTYAQEVLGHMITSRTTGRLLSMLSCLMQPLTVLEIGTFTGYGTICLAEGLAHGGIVHTIEVNPETVLRARRNFASAGITEKVVLHEGDARKIILELSGPFDIIFLDADKKNYAVYYTMLLPLLRAGGLLIADNVLWYNKVLTPADDKDAQALDAFNKLVKQDESTSNILLTIDDGLMLIRKST